VLSLCALCFVFGFLDLKTPHVFGLLLLLLQHFDGGCNAEEVIRCSAQK
jgi:hypothetical protein